MRILHTSDWHLGKQLNGYSRLEEQEEFLEQLIEIIINEEVDLLLIAGDIYDTVNPVAKAEKLFYKFLDKVLKNREIKIVVIAGNHDNEKRLTAVRPLVEDEGVIIVGNFYDVIGEDTKDVVETFEGGFKLKVKDEEAVIVTMPYPSDKTLKMVISGTTEKKYQENYSEIVNRLIEESGKNFEKDSINIIVGHFFAMNGEVTESEKNIQVGGGYTVNTKDMGENCDYIALGHLHKNQKFKSKSKKSFYSGSPIQYSKSEYNQKKVVKIIEKGKDGNVTIKDIDLKIYKEIKIIKATDFEHLIKQMEEIKKDCYLFIEIDVYRLKQSEINEIKKMSDSIVSIELTKMEKSIDSKNVNYNEQSIEEIFLEYCKHTGLDDESDLKKDVILLFNDIIKEGESQ